jgi:hypothetical protein
MFKPHFGRQERRHSFAEAWRALWAGGEQELSTRVGTPFVARAALTTRRPRRGREVIRYLQRGREYSRCYECCWHRYQNCNRALAGMYNSAVDKWLA